MVTCRDSAVLHFRRSGGQEVLRGVINAGAEFDKMLVIVEDW